jgi:hypothetical protein
VAPLAFSRIAGRSRHNPIIVLAHELVLRGENPLFAAVPNNSSIKVKPKFRNSEIVLVVVLVLVLDLVGLSTSKDKRTRRVRESVGLQTVCTLLGLPMNRLVRKKFADLRNK